MDQKPDNAIEKALVTIKRLREKLETSTARSAEPIAVIGIGCRFPGNANGPEAFWDLMWQGVDAITEIPASRWSIDEYYNPDPDIPGKMSSRWGGFIDGVDNFAASFFGITPKEANGMDPQQRILLETVWEALEHGGVSADSLIASKTGVFIGMSGSDYIQLQIKSNNISDIDAYCATGNVASATAGRLSYVLGLQGPCMAVDTACSSSLVTVNLACQSLRLGESDMAIAGGVNLMLMPEVTITLSKAHMMASDGHCKTFDSAADGFVRGEGCGVVVLKRLSDALANKDPVLAVIRGSAVNQDGKSQGLTAPNGIAQQAVITSALQNAGAKATDVSYVETHGTGTELGDPIEVQALSAALGQGRDKNSPIILGSTKTNIGHLEAAAGIAGLIKVVLALQKKQIPPHLHLNNPNPHIPWSNLPVQINTQASHWNSDNSRIAGVSSFGFSGTNAHVILQEASTAVSDSLPMPRPWQILALSAKTDTALQAMAQRYADYLQQHPEQKLANICHTANTGRAQFAHRLAIPATNSAELQQALQRYCECGEADVAQGKADQPAQIAFMFTGQGAQYPDMARQLFDSEPRFREILQQCETLLSSHLDKPLLSIMYPDTPEQANLLNQTVYTQPALFALEYALARLWQSWGVEPDLLIGHSVGEYVAACIAGVFSLEEGLRLIAARARLMHALPQGGAMAAVFAPVEQLADRVKAHADQVSIAAINGPQQTVVSGQRDVLQALLEQWQQQGINGQLLAVSHAFHSPLLEPMLDAFEEIAQSIHYQAPKRAIISNLTGERISPDTVLDASYWRQHVRQPVLFYPGLQSLAKQGCQLAIEIGPAPILTGLVERSGLFSDITCLASLAQKTHDWECLSNSLARLYTQGYNIDWAELDKAYACQRLAGLPTYPFERKRFWYKETNNSENSLLKNIYDISWEKIDTLSQNNHSLDKLSAGAWLIICEEQPLTDHLHTSLTNAGHTTFSLESNQYRCKGEAINGTNDRLSAIIGLLQKVKSLEIPFHGILYINNFIASEPVSPIQISESALQINCELQDIHKALKTVSLKTTRGFWVITHNGQAVASTPQAVNPLQTSIWGVSRVIANEISTSWGGLIDIDPLISESTSASSLLHAVIEQKADQLAIQTQGIFQPKLSALNSLTISKPEFSNSKSYLVTGAFGGIGQALVKWLADNGAGHLILVTRNLGSLQKAKKLLEELTLSKTGHTIINCDVSQQDDVNGMFARIKHELPPLAGVFHCAGTIEDSLLIDSTAEQMHRILAPKVCGTWLLDQQTHEIALDYFVLFSSASTVLGTPGQSSYAMANSFMEGVAKLRQSKGLAASCVHWGAWHKLGMTAESNNETMHGRKTIQTKEGVEILSSLMSNSSCSCTVLSMDWQQFFNFLPKGHKISLLDNIQKEQVKTVVNSKQKSKYSKLLDTLVDAQPAMRKDYLLDFIKQCITDASGVNCVQLDKYSNLLELGLDSLMIMSIVTSCEKQLNLRLYPNEFYRHPVLTDLVDYLLSELKFETHNKTEKETRFATLESKSEHFISNENTDLIDKLPKTLFLLSSPRSGSTLLRVMLAGHPKLFVPPELHLLPFSDMHERQAQLGDIHLDEGLTRAVMELNDINAQQANKLVSQWVSQKRSIAEIYAELIKNADRLLVDKSPTYALDINVLKRAERMFNKPQYLFISRHPYSVIDSFVSNRMDKLMSFDTNDPYKLAEDIWYQTNNNIQELFKSIDSDRVHSISYEQLVTEPHETITGVCKFLNIDFEKQLLEPYSGKRMTDGIHQRSLGIGDPNFMNHTSINPDLADKWKQVNLQDKLQSKTEKLATTLGYNLQQKIPAEKTQVKTNPIVVSVKEATREQASLFCVHPAGGQVAVYFKFADSLNIDMGICALQSRALNDPLVEFSSIEKMAIAYTQAIREVQAQGPYYLLGWSMGGRICTEIAAQIEKLGETVAFLGLIDSRYPVEPEGNKIPSVKMGITLAFGGVIAQAFDNMPTPVQQQLTHKLNNLNEKEKIRQTIQWAKSRSVLPPQLNTDDLLLQAILVEQHVNLLRNHKPKSVDIPIYVWWGKEELKRRPKTDWSKYTSMHVTEEIIEGSHFTMMQAPNLNKLTKSIEKVLSESKEKVLPA